MGKNNFNQSRGKSGHKFNENQSKFKSSSKRDQKFQHKSQNPQQKIQKREKNQHKNENATKIIDENDSKRVHYVLNPKALRRKIQEVKESEQKAREKSFLDKSKI